MQDFVERTTNKQRGVNTRGGSEYFTYTTSDIWQENSQSYEFTNKLLYISKSMQRLRSRFTDVQRAQTGNS